MTRVYVMDEGTNTVRGIWIFSKKGISMLPERYTYWYYSKQEALAKAKELSKEVE